MPTIQSLGLLAMLLLASCGSISSETSRMPGYERVALAPEADLTELARLGFIQDHGKGNRFGYLPKEALRQVQTALALAPEPAITAEDYEGYHDYAALTSELQALAQSYPSLVRLETAGQSVQGRELWYVVVSDNAADLENSEHEPKFIYHANMHGDEVVGRELMIYFLRHILAAYGTDQTITQLINHSQLFVMPSMNPDGFERGTRSNANGYDLNRNFPDRFRSPNDTPVGRQIEVQHMMNLALENHFVYGLNWHGGEICFNLPWGNISNSRIQDRYGDDHFFAPIGREYTTLNAPMYANHESNFDHGLTYGYEWYPVNGGINDWYNYYRRSVHSVVELTVTKWPPSSTLAGHWDDNRQAMITYLWRGLRGLHLEIRGTDGSLIQTPTVELAASPGRPLTFDDGYVHRLTGDGEQTVTISAPGFLPSTIQQAASYFDGTFVQVTLQPER